MSRRVRRVVATNRPSIIDPNMLVACIVQSAGYHAISHLPKHCLVDVGGETVPAKKSKLSTLSRTSRAKTKDPCVRTRMTIPSVARGIRCRGPMSGKQRSAQQPQLQSQLLPSETLCLHQAKPLSDHYTSRLRMRCRLPGRMIWIPTKSQQNKKRKK